MTVSEAHEETPFKQVEKEKSVNVEDEQEEIFGGEFLNYVPLQEKFNPIKHEAQTTRWLGIMIIGFLFFSSSIHYGATAWLHQKGKVETALFLADIFDKWFPAITAITGSIVAYYFTRNENK